MATLLRLEGAEWRYDMYRYQCSACKQKLETSSEDEPAFCWNCGLKFGPEPKVEPTGGDWYVDKGREGDDDSVYSSLDHCQQLIAEVCTQDTPGQRYANALVMAASKKLLAACKVLVLKVGTRDYLEAHDPQALKQAEEAIESTKPK